MQGIWACVLALSGSFDTLTDYVIFGSWIFYALVTSSIFVFRQKYPDAERPYKAFGYPVVPVLVFSGRRLAAHQYAFDEPETIIYRDFLDSSRIARLLLFD